MAKYKKKPVLIEAYHYDHELLGIEPERMETKWLSEAFETGILHYRKGQLETEWLLFIATLEGTMEVSMGDYIIQGVKGELYPCKPDIFEATYEKVWPLSPLLENQNIDVGSMTDEEWRKHLDGLKCQNE